MTEPLKSPHRFAVAANPQMPEALELANAIASHLSQKELTALNGQLSDHSLRAAIEGEEVDLLVALGGDGTMLRAGHLCAPYQVPILGINLGRFGFLTEVNRESWQPSLERVILGDYWIEERMMLRGAVYRQGALVGTWEVLNEFVVSRGEIVRPVRLTAEIDGRYLTTYVADGLIVATPTGSTAYALAAGGPILPPDLRNILLVPVAPHLSVDRGIVLHEGSWVRVTVRTDHQAILSTDGQVALSMEDRDHVEVCAGDHTARFIRLQDPGYFYRNLTSRMNQNPSAGVNR